MRETKREKAEFQRFVGADTVDMSCKIDIVDDMAAKQIVPRVVFIGGLERLEREITSFGEHLGLDIATHNGHTWGGGSARLILLVQRSDVVVIVTGTNSHNAVQMARREAAKVGARVVLLKFLGARTARTLLTEISQQAAA